MILKAEDIIGSPIAYKGHIGKSYFFLDPTEGLEDDERIIILHQIDVEWFL